MVAVLLCACGKDTTGNESAPGVRSALSAVQDCIKQTQDCTTAAKTDDDRNACSAQLRACVQPVASSLGGLDGGAAPATGPALAPPAVPQLDAGVPGAGAGVPGGGAGLPGLPAALPGLGSLAGLGGAPATGIGGAGFDAGLGGIGAGLLGVDAGGAPAPTTNTEPTGLAACLGALETCLAASSSDPMTCATTAETCLQGALP